MFFFFQRKKYGMVSEPLLLWGRSPQMLWYFLGMWKTLNRKSSPLNPRLRALICIKVSQINSCAFCIDRNATLFLDRGGTVKEIEELREYAGSLLFNEGEKMALKYASLVTQHAEQVDDLLVRKLQQHFSDDAIVELTALIGFQNMSSKFNTALSAEKPD